MIFDPVVHPNKKPDFHKQFLKSPLHDAALSEAIRDQMIDALTDQIARQDAYLREAFQGTSLNPDDFTIEFEPASIERLDDISRDTLEYRFTTRFRVVPRP
jgi:hypothetical protein